MKNDEEIRWVQLSDLHMFDSTESGAQKEALFHKLQGTIDFFVITGDLHQYNTSYQMTKDFLEELVSEMEIEKKDIIIVPGNHDVVTTEKRNDIIAKINSSIEDDIDAYRKDLNILLKAFNRYKKFLTEFYGKEIEKFDPLKNHVYVWNDEIAIVCLNTALVSDGDHYKPQITDCYRLQNLKNTVVPCIAVMHHSYYEITKGQQDFIKNSFKKLGVSAALSGHKHRFSENMISLKNGESIPDFCSAKAVSQPGDLWSDIGFIEYRWKKTEQDVKVIPYEWSRKQTDFVPSLMFEEKAEVHNDGSIIFEKSFKIRNPEKRTETVPTEKTKKENNREKQKENPSDIEEFFSTVQQFYLDGSLERIKHDRKKLDLVVSVMEKVIRYQGKNIKFDDIFGKMISSNEKLVLTINGLQGTGKSTFFSMIYYRMMEIVEQTKQFPVLLDLRHLEKYNKNRAKEKLTRDLKKIHGLIENNSDMTFFLLLDGMDEFVRKTSWLEDILYNEINSYDTVKVAFCVSKAENLPDEVKKTSNLKNLSCNSVYTVEARGIKKQDRDGILFMIEKLCKIYGFVANDDKTRAIKAAVSRYAINELDYRTTLMGKNSHIFVFCCQFICQVTVTHTV